MQAHAQSNGQKQDGGGEERNVMLNAADANKPREIQIGLPSEDVNVYENGLPAVYSSSVHKLSAHWRNDASLGQTGLLSPSESAITTGNIAYSVTGFTDLGQKDFDRTCISVCKVKHVFNKCCFATSVFSFDQIYVVFLKGEGNRLV